MAALDAVFYSIAWWHRLAGLQVCPTNHPLVKGTLEGARHMLARPMCSKEPLSLELIERTTDAYRRIESLAVRSFLFILLVGYAGFFRIDEIQGLRVMDVSIYTEHISVFIAKRKNNQFREGYKSNKATCPVRIMTQLMELLPSSSVVRSPLVKRIIKSKRKERCHDPKGVSYTTSKSEFHKYVSPFEKDINIFGTHSIKPGAASNPSCHNITSNLLDKHTGCKCPLSKLHYIKYTEKDLRGVSAAL